MLDKETLEKLRLKLPRGYYAKVSTAYETRFSKSISRPTVSRFFDGKTYSENLHLAILDVTSAHQLLIEKTTEAINA